MGLYKKALETYGGEYMGKIDLSGPEAGIAFSTLVAFSDDNPSEEEGAVMRKYYRSGDAESFQKKLEAAGYNYPSDLSALMPEIMEALKNTSRDFQLRTVAVGYLLAKADGNFDRREMSLLSSTAGELGFSLYDAKIFAEERLKEIDEVSGYEDFREPEDGSSALDLTLDEAGAALSILVGFSDDDPSDAEAAVMREYFRAESVTSLMEKLEKEGVEYPASLHKTKAAIRKAFEKASRDDRLRMLAIAWKVAGADGNIDELEKGLIEEFCGEFVIGLSEVRDYFKAAPV